MRISARALLACAWVSLLLYAVGCATREINPSAAKPGRGYADLFTQPKSDVWWKVEVMDPQNQNYVEFTSEYKAPPLGILRVAARPGRHKARITFLNHAVEAPAEVEVEIKEGMITPIRVSTEQAGTTLVRTVETRASPATRNPMSDSTQTRWRISATALPPAPYAPKEAAAYWK